MRRYDDPGDTIPHETNILVLSEDRGCYGDPFETHFDAVRARITCDKLMIEEYYHDLSDLSDRERLVQHGIWVIDHDCLLRDAYAELDHYLDTESYPDSTAVVICIDPNTVDDLDARENALREEYEDATIVTDATSFRGVLVGFLAAVNPCSPSGREYILRWNNEIADDLDIA